MDEDVQITVGDLMIYPWHPRRIPRDTRKKAIRNLAGYLHCFLASAVFPGNAKRAKNVVESILAQAKLQDEKITFKFPNDIEQQFALSEFRMPLNEHAPFALYCEKLIPKSRLACIILIEEKNTKIKAAALKELQSLILKSSQRIKRISIKKSAGKSAVLTASITLNKKGQKVILTPASSLSESIDKIEEVLL